MKKAEKEEIERLVNLTNADMNDKHKAQEFVRLYINKGFKACMTCDPSVRSMFKILRKWWSEQNKEAYQFIKTK
jgi:uncharacterized protein involved in tolerance to divalent cations